jgi:hypothetical protein
MGRETTELIKNVGIGIIVLLTGSALVEGACASGKKDGGKAVVVVTDFSAVRGCAFLARVTQTSIENTGDAPEGTMRLRTAEAGGNTLLIRPGGIGEAWDCPQTLHAYAENPNPTPTKLDDRRFPTPLTTPRF